MKRLLYIIVALAFLACIIGLAYALLVNPPDFNKALLFIVGASVSLGGGFLIDTFIGNRMIEKREREKEHSSSSPVSNVTPPSAISSKKSRVKFREVCKCGNYEPKSTKGVIDLRCKNCGGERPELKY